MKQPKVTGISVLARNKAIFTDLCQQAQGMVTILIQRGFPKADLDQELTQTIAQGSDDNKYNLGIKALNNFIAQTERAKRVVVLGDFRKSAERFSKTKDWFDDRGASKRLLDQLTKGINAFNKQVRAAKSLDERVNAYVEMRELVVKVQAEFFVEAKEVKTTKFVGRPLPLKTSDVMLRRAV